MSDRTVKVDTILGAGAKEGMEQLGFKVKEVDGQVDRLNRDLKQTADETAKAAATMELLKAATSGAAGKVDEFGNKRTVIQDLDMAISQTQGHVRALGEEFNRTGSTNAFAGLTRAKSDLKDLENLRKDVDGALKTGAEDAGKEAGHSFISSFGSAIQGIVSTPVLGPLSLAAIAAISALLLPAIDGAFIALGTLGGLATGVIGQLKNPRIQTAIKDFSTSFMTEFQTDTASFADPVIASLSRLGTVLKDTLRSIDFSSLAKELEPFIEAIGNLISNMMPGFNKMLESSGPIMVELGADLQDLGSALSMMFELISHSGKGAVEGLRFAFGLLDAVIVSIGAAVLIASQVFHFMVETFNVVSGAAAGFFAVLEKIASNPIFQALANIANAAHTIAREWAEANEPIEHVGKSLEHTGGSAKSAGVDFDKAAASLAQVKNTADSVEAAMAKKLFDTIMNVDQAVIAWHRSLLNLHDTLNQNGKAIDRHTGLVDLNTKSGLANREAVLAAMTANMQQYQAFIAAGGAADVATKQYNDNTAALEKQLHAAGYNQKAIDDMIGSLKSVPRKTEAEIAMYGLIEAINNLGNLLAELNHLNGSSYGFTVTDKHVYESDYITHQQGEHGRWGGIYEHAAAGKLRDASVYSPVDPGRYMIAEPQTGGEAFVPRLGDYGRSTSILDQAARWYGGRFAPGGPAGGNAVIALNLNVSLGPGGDTRAAGQQIANVLGPWIAANGGNVQRALVGRAVP